MSASSASFVINAGGITSSPVASPPRSSGASASFQIPPPLMRALWLRLHQHQLGIDVDRDAPLLRLTEPEDRRAGDQLVLQDPEHRTLTSDLLMPLGQVARGEKHRPFLAAQSEPLGEVVDAFRAERDFGEVERHSVGNGR